MTISQEFMHPEMMAIGDSLYQGVRSLTIETSKMRNSAPVQVAHALGIGDEFSYPDPLRPILIDMENWLSMLPDLAEVKTDLAENTDYWFARPKSPSGRPLFENVSVAGSTIADLYEQTWQKADDFLKKLPAGTKAKIKNFQLSPTIVKALNNRFTLNPMGRAGLKNMSQIELVAARKPKRLLINIGSNNGLWDMAFDGKANGSMTYKKQLRKLAKKLNQLPADVEHIYFNNLALPSAVPNLMPLPDMVEWDENKKPGKGKYYGQYENRFGLKYGSMTGVQLAVLDNDVRDANADIKAILNAAFDNPSRLHFVDLAKMLSDFDSKHQKRAASNVIKLKNRKTLTNVMNNAGPFGGFARGGFQGLDGMHPTLVGYGVMAQRVLNEIKRYEGTRTVKINLDDAFEKDSLLTNMPAIWSFGLWLWRDIRRATADNQTLAVDQADEQAICDIFTAACNGFR